MENGNTILGRFFTQNAFNDFLQRKHYDAYHAVIKRTIDNPSSKKNGELISEIYAYLSKNYRNEYFYKNTLLNKLLLGIHKPTTTTALTEIPVGKSKADFILINGKAVVYEIKTGLDSFDRLETQLNDYFRAFDHVAVLTDEINKNSIQKKLQDSNIGIYLLTKRNQISCIRPPKKCSSNLDLGEIFKILNKSEFENILLKKYGFLPDVVPVKYYKECRKLFSAIEKDEGYSLFLGELKKRNKIDVVEYNMVQRELKSLVYFSRYSKKDYDDLKSFLDRKYEG